MTSLLLRHELRRGRVALVLWSTILPLLALFRMAEFPAFHDKYAGSGKALAQFSESEVEAFGLSDLPLTEIVGYYGGRVYSILVLLGALYVVMLSATILSKEEDDGTIEFLLAKPLTRRTILGAKALSVLALTVAFNTAIFLASLGMVIAFEQDGYDLGALGLLAFGSLLVHLVFGAVGLAISAFIVSARRLYPICIGLVVVAYFLVIVANTTDGASAVQWFSPFSYVDPSEIVAGDGIGVPQLIVLTTAIVGGLLLATTIYERKDIAA